MKVTTIEYGRLISHGDHENTSLKATAILRDGDDPGGTTEALKKWVEKELERIIATKDDTYKLRDSANRLRWTVEDYQRRLEEAKTRWDAAVRLLGRHGIDIPREPSEYPINDMPF